MKDAHQLFIWTQSGYLLHQKAWTLFIFWQPENSFILMGEKHRSFFSLNTQMTSTEEEFEDEWLTALQANMVEMAQEGIEHNHAFEKAISSVF